jgi:hypothetical protein
LSEFFSILSIQKIFPFLNHFKIRAESRLSLTFQRKDLYLLSRRDGFQRGNARSYFPYQGYLRSWPGFIGSAERGSSKEKAETATFWPVSNISYFYLQGSVFSRQAKRNLKVNFLSPGTCF